MQPAASQSFDIYEKVISCFLSKKLTHVYLVLYFFFPFFGKVVFYVVMPCGGSKL